MRGRRGDCTANGASPISEDFLVVGPCNSFEGVWGRVRPLPRLPIHFLWPSMYEEVAQTRALCPECQWAKKGKPPRALLQTMPVIDTPFTCIPINVVGPLPKISAGHQYILVLINYTTQHAGAVSIRAVAALHIMEELLKWIVRVGIPKEVLTDHSTNFMSGVMKAVCQTLGIKYL